jgi:hypothetical protein
MRHALAALLLVGVATPTLAQDVPEITVRPLDDGRGGDAYVGPYGRDLPGVSMFSGRAAGLTPSFPDGDVKIPSRQKIPAEYTYQDPLPPLDAWHGTLGGGIPF